MVTSLIVTDVVGASDMGRQAATYAHTLTDVLGLTDTVDTVTPIPVVIDCETWPDTRGPVLTMARGPPRDRRAY